VFGEEVAEDVAGDLFGLLGAHGKCGAGWVYARRRECPAPGCGCQYGTVS
jgi:hypothetical protein